MSQSLATKYRPQDWSDMVGQEAVIKVLKRQIETNQIRNCYMFYGSSGCGKTTAARIFANKVNSGNGIPIEIDAASNNGVDNIRDIIAEAQRRAIDCVYKVYILDECHMLSMAAWNAMLKLVEEPPQYTIFIFCTTDIQKVPATILNRVQLYCFTKIQASDVVQYLKYICQQENATNYVDATEYIAKTNNGGLRDAISTLDKCLSFSRDLALPNVTQLLGECSYEKLFILTNGLLDSNRAVVFAVLNQIYNDGVDLKVFVNRYLNFLIDILKYIIFKSCDVIKIPASMENNIKNVINFEQPEKYYNYLMDHILDLKNMLKNDEDARTTIDAVFAQLTQGD